MDLIPSLQLTPIFYTLGLKQTFWSLLQHTKIKVVPCLQGKLLGVFFFFIPQQDLTFFILLITVTIFAPAPGYRAGMIQWSLVSA